MKKCRGDPLDLLRKMRVGRGKVVTEGLPDETIADLLAYPFPQLADAIGKAYERSLKLTAATSYGMPEAELIARVQDGWCNFYPESMRNPYVPLAAAGPWIITVHGAVLHDNGGYGMLSFGHTPNIAYDAVCEDLVIANVMTPSFAHEDFLTAIRKEIGRNRSDGCPYSHFVLMNSGSEANSVADRIIDLHTGNVVEKLKPAGGVRCIALRGGFHGRTYRPALWSDSNKSTYTEHKAYSLMHTFKHEYCWLCDVNDAAMMEGLFERAKRENVFIEAVFMEAVMGEGNPGFPLDPAFYAKTRELTLANDAMFLVDSIQAGIRATGNLSITDYPGFEKHPAPDFEVYSKAINASQYPVSCVAMTARAEESFRHGVYGNTMTCNPRACRVTASVLNQMTDEIRANIVNMGLLAKQKYEALRKEEPFSKLITNISGSGLLYAVELDSNQIKVVADDPTKAAETCARTLGLGVIHGGANALRFTPHFLITERELDLQVDLVRKTLLTLCPETEKKITVAVDIVPGATDSTAENDAQNRSSSSA